MAGVRSVQIFLYSFTVFSLLKALCFFTIFPSKIHDGKNTVLKHRIGRRISFFRNGYGTQIQKNVSPPSALLSAHGYDHGSEYLPRIKAEGYSDYKHVHASHKVSCRQLTEYSNLPSPENSEPSDRLPPHSYRAQHKFLSFMAFSMGITCLGAYSFFGRSFLGP